MPFPLPRAAVLTTRGEAAYARRPVSRQPEAEGGRNPLKSGRLQAAR